MELNIFPFSENEIAKTFREKFYRRGSSLSEEDWEKLSREIEGHYPIFFTLISRNNMNERQFRLCLLTKAEFSTQEIEYLLGVTPGYSAHTKERLFKKLFGTEGKSRDFDLKILKMQ